MSYIRLFQKTPPDFEIFGVFAFVAPFWCIFDQKEQQMNGIWRFLHESQKANMQELIALRERIAQGEKRGKRDRERYRLAKIRLDHCEAHLANIEQ